MYIGAIFLRRRTKLSVFNACFYLLFYRSWCLLPPCLPSPFCPVQCLHICFHLFPAVNVFGDGWVQYSPVHNVWARTCASARPQGMGEQTLQM